MTAVVAKRLSFINGKLVQPGERTVLPPKVKPGKNVRVLGSVDQEAVEEFIPSPVEGEGPAQAGPITEDPITPAIEFDPLPIIAGTIDEAKPLIAELDITQLQLVHEAEKSAKNRDGMLNLLHDAMRALS